MTTHLTARIAWHNDGWDGRLGWLLNRRDCCLYRLWSEQKR